MLKKIEKLPDSTGWELKAKDYLKGLGLAILFFISQSLPEIKEALTAHDFGEYNNAVKFLFFCVAWLLQRFFKNNSV